LDGCRSSGGGSRIIGQRELRMNAELQERDKASEEEAEEERGDDAAMR
jgi:hypothetical protein